MKTLRNLVQIYLLYAAMLPAVVQAQFTYTTDNDETITITDYTGNEGTVNIPSTINGLPVTSIGINAFETNQIVTSITISNGVASIGDNAFFDCTNLGNINIPSSVTNIGSWAFAYCEGLTNITSGNGITSIGDHAFYYCSSVTNVTIGSGVPSIGSQTFYFCTNLTSVTIPDSVTNIGYEAFTGCILLTSAKVGNGVTDIGYAAFGNCYNLTSVTIGNSVTNIEENAFIFCNNLADVYFLGNAPTITSGAFYNDDQATVYYLPGMTGWGATIGDYPGPPLPTLLWNPQAQTGDGSFGVQTNQFGFNIIGSSNLVIVVEASTNLSHPVWLPVSTNMLNTFVGTNGISYFSDAQWTNYSSRFYRFRSP